MKLHKISFILESDIGGDKIGAIDIIKEMAEKLVNKFSEKYGETNLPFGICFNDSVIIWEPINKDIDSGSWSSQYHENPKEKE